ncbi:MAG: hypothetical protein HYV42_02200 [Candidatus Magasanikbacteria bacterium]|nr:hypothetical protein [Candidatus Magasanikbacteria bacterium]
MRSTFHALRKFFAKRRAVLVTITTVVALLIVVPVLAVGNLPDNSDFDARASKSALDIATKNAAQGGTNIVEQGGGNLGDNPGSFNFWSTGMIFTWDWWTGLFASILLTVATFFIKLTLFILTFIIEIAAYNGYLDATAVNVGWVMVRDITNMFFVLVLLLMAFGTILGIEQYEWKKMIAKFAIAAILVNFSRLIIGVLIDISQLVMTTFVNGVVATAGGNLINAFNLEKIVKLHNAAQPAQLASPGIFTASLGAVVFAGMAMAVMGIYLFILVARLIGLWVLIVLSPFAFVLSVLPTTASFAGKWWRELGDRLVTGPVLMFFIWLSFVTVGSAQRTPAEELAYYSDIPETSKIKTGEIAAIDQLGGQRVGISDAMGWNNIANFAIAIGMLIAGAKVASEIGGSSGSALTGVASFGKKVATIASGYALGRWLYEGGKGITQKAGIGLAKVGARVTPFPSWAKRAKTYVAGQLEGARAEALTPEERIKSRIQENADGSRRIVGLDVADAEGWQTVGFEKEMVEASMKTAWAKGGVLGVLLQRANSRYMKEIQSEKIAEKNKNFADRRAEIMRARVRGVPKYWLQGKLYGAGEDVDAVDRMEQGIADQEKKRSAAKTEQFQSIGRAWVAQGERVQYERQGFGYKKVEQSGQTQADLIQKHLLQAERNKQNLARLEGEAKVKLAVGSEKAAVAETTAQREMAATAAAQFKTVEAGEKAAYLGDTTAGAKTLKERVEAEKEEHLAEERAKEAKKEAETEFYRGDHGQDELAELAAIEARTRALTTEDERRKEEAKDEALKTATVTTETGAQSLAVAHSKEQEMLQETVKEDIKDLESAVRQQLIDEGKAELENIRQQLAQLDEESLTDTEREAQQGLQEAQGRLERILAGTEAAPGITSLAQLDKEQKAALARPQQEIAEFKRGLEQAHTSLLKDETYQRRDQLRTKLEKRQEELLKVQAQDATGTPVQNLAEIKTDIVGWEAALADPSITAENKAILTKRLKQAQAKAAFALEAEQAGRPIKNAGDLQKDIEDLEKEEAALPVSSEEWAMRAIADELQRREKTVQDIIDEHNRRKAQIISRAEEVVGVKQTKERFETDDYKQKVAKEKAVPAYQAAEADRQARREQLQQSTVTSGARWWQSKLRAQVSGQTLKQAESELEEAGFELPAFGAMLDQLQLSEVAEKAAKSFVEKIKQAKLGKIFENGAEKMREALEAVKKGMKVEAVVRNLRAEGPVAVGALGALAEVLEDYHKDITGIQKTAAKDYAESSWTTEKYGLSTPTSAFKNWVKKRMEQFQGVEREQAVTMAIGSLKHIAALKKAGKGDKDLEAQLMANIKYLTTNGWSDDLLARIHNVIRENQQGKYTGKARDEAVALEQAFVDDLGWGERQSDGSIRIVKSESSGLSTNDLHRLMGFAGDSKLMLSENAVLMHQERTQQTTGQTMDYSEAAQDLAEKIQQGTEAGKDYTAMATELGLVELGQEFGLATDRVVNEVKAFGERFAKEGAAAKDKFIKSIRDFSDQTEMLTDFKNLAIATMHADDGGHTYFDMKEGFARGQLYKNAMGFMMGEFAKLDSSHRMGKLKIHSVAHMDEDWGTASHFVPEAMRTIFSGINSQIMIERMDPRNQNLLLKLSATEKARKKDGRLLVGDAFSDLTSKKYGHYGPQAVQIAMKDIARDWAVALQEAPQILMTLLAKHSGVNFADAMNGKLNLMMGDGTKIGHLRELISWINKYRGATREAYEADSRAITEFMDEDREYKEVILSQVMSALPKPEKGAREIEEQFAAHEI